jgi:hypothetical protein
MRLILNKSTNTQVSSKTETNLGSRTTDSKSFQITGITITMTTNNNTYMSQKEAYLKDFKMMEMRKLMIREEFREVL